MVDGAVFVALIFAGKMTRSEGGAAAAIEICGLSLLERQLRQLRRCGVTRVIVHAPTPAQSFEASVRRMERDGQTVVLAATAEELADAIRGSGGEHFLVARGDALVDDRIFAAVRAHAGDCVIAGEAGEAAAFLSARGVAVAKVAEDALSDATGFEQVIERVRGRAAVIDISAQPTYVAGLRRHQPMLFEIVDDPRDRIRLTREIIERGQKGTLDWPARFLHPPLENFLTRILSGTVVTPNQISVFAAILGFLAAWFFAQGRFYAALPLALVVAVLDGVDGKLARAKLMQTKLGQAEHLLDKAVEYSWYLALAAYFSPLYGAAVWGLALVIVGFAAAEAVQGEFYRRLTGAQLDDAGDFERAWRLIGGRRNTFIWTFALFVMTGAAYAGYWFIAIYALITFFVAQTCFILRLKTYAGGVSDAIARNIQGTAYL